MWITRRHRTLDTSIKTVRRAYSVSFPTRTASRLPQQTDLLERYRSLVTLGRITHDEQQIRIVMQLRRLQRQLDGYAPPAVASALLAQQAGASADDDVIPWWTSSPPEHKVSLIRVRTLPEALNNLDTPKGLLLTGPPGSGKSFLFDLWYASLPTPYKTRKHYNQLVLELYRAVWEETQRRMGHVRGTDPPAPVRRWNSALRDQWCQLAKRDLLPLRWRRHPRDGFTTQSSGDALPTIAFVIAQRLVLRHWLLVFDEVQLLDVSSAGLLSDVLSWYWRMGGVVVGTSNKVPDDLYKNGVQRERLEPFVEALKMRCPVVSLSTSQDWRRVRGAKLTGRTWFTWGQEAAFKESLQSFTRESRGDVAAEPSDVMDAPARKTLDVFGRRVPVPWSLNGVCKFSFVQLCDESLGPADYLTLASAYHTVAVTDIPVLGLSAKNQARRFISLIDALYEARCRLICHAEANPEDLFFPSAAHATESTSAVDHDVMHIETVAEMQDVYRPNVAMYSAPSMSEARAQSTVSGLDKLDIFSGQEERFAFQRALSRLVEMTSSSYRHEEKWNPLPSRERKWECRVDPISTEHETIRGEKNSTDELNARPEAPRLGPDHVWGVREDWGERAGQWGQGVKALNNI